MYLERKRLGQDGYAVLLFCILLSVSALMITSIVMSHGGQLFDRIKMNHVQSTEFKNLVAEIGMVLGDKTACTLNFQHVSVAETNVPLTISYSTPTGLGSVLASVNQNYGKLTIKQLDLLASPPGTFVSQTFTNGVQCDNNTFGDPLYGTFKHCEIQDPSGNFIFCVDEHGYCNFSGTQVVRYGAYSTTTYQKFMISLNATAGEGGAGHDFTLKLPIYAIIDPSGKITSCFSSLFYNGSTLQESVCAWKGAMYVASTQKCSF